MQGKEFTPEQREMIIESLRPFLELGYSRSRACKLTGLDESTLSRWSTKDEALSMKLQAWGNTVDALVMSNLVDAIRIEGETDDAKKETTKWWAERKMKKDFSVKIETEQVGDVQPVLVEIINEKPKENTNTEGTV